MSRPDALHSPQATDPADPHADHGEHNAIAHVMPVWMLLSVFAALLVLTAATVFFAGFELGRYEVMVAMGIATIKAGLVATFFMHLRYDNPLNAVILLFSLIFVSLFLGLTILDTQAYQGEIDEWRDAEAAKAATGI